MKLFRSTLLLLGETAALGWFILHNLSFVALLPLIPLALLFYRFHKVPMEKVKWLNGVCALISVAITAFIVSVGIFDGRGFIALCFLIIAASFMAIGVPGQELDRISGWWLAGFAVVFTIMFVATLPGVRWRSELPEIGPWQDILVFYLLAFLEPLSMGREYRAAPMALGILLLPFALAAYLALGNGAFSLAEYPYLSVWAGVAISAFHHIEGIILCFYCGVGALRAAYFINPIFKNGCNQECGAI